jgi:hypothetical protein
MNLPAEPGGYADLPGERPEPIDAMMRMAGQYPQLAGMLQSKMGPAFTGAMIDPLNTQKRRAEIADKEARAYSTRLTAPATAAQRYGAADQSGSRADYLDSQTQGQELENELRQKAAEAIRMGDLDSARLYLMLADNKPWESSEEKAYGSTKGQIQAKSEAGIPFYKPSRPPSERGQKPDYVKMLLDLEVKVKNGTATSDEIAQHKILREKMIKSDWVRELVLGGRTGGGGKNPNYK